MSLRAQRSNLPDRVDDVFQQLNYRMDREIARRLVVPRNDKRGCHLEAFLAEGSPRQFKGNRAA